MSVLQEKHLPKSELRRLGVQALVLFGSQAQGIAHKGSDYDIGVLMDDNRILQSPAERTQLYHALYDMLAELIQQLVPIDIVFLDAQKKVVDKTSLRPWMLNYTPKKAAKYFVEMPTGNADKIKLGDLLEWNS